MEANPERAMMYPEAFANTLQATLDNLATAVEVTLVSAPNTIEPGATFVVTVRVENKTGHKFPTGYVDARQAWIGVALVDCDGVETPLVGGYDIATGEVQAEPPTHVYKAVHGRWDGTQGVEEMSMVKQDMHLSDTRIPPKGFAPTLATMPSSEIDYSDGAGGWNHFDEVTFTVTAPATLRGPQTLSAHVLFQEMRRDFVEFLRDANTTNTKGDELWDIYVKLGEAEPHQIASATQQYDGECPMGTGGAGGTAGAAGSGGSGGESAGTGGAGTGGAAGKATDSGEDSSCGCRVPASSDGRPLGLLGLGLVVALARRRRAVEGRSWADRA
jgi:MYXO-CTERM domain-containing protein